MTSTAARHPGPPRTNPVLRGFLTMAALSFSTPGLAGDDPPAPDTAVVSYTMNPGEPEAHGESVTVARRGTAHTLTVARKEPGQAARTATVAITPEQFASAWTLVTRDKLLEFTPEETPGRVFDYGERILRTETQAEPGSATVIREVRWRRPPANADRIGPLAKALGTLAREHVPNPLLEHFAP